ncbi:MAG: helix-turn-helix transcriptional regulator [Candidatus Omnitrophica bacterium]|nr:helix-turn-helix transcriptional regulator [Candidatus Omnitrophota bacterium]
MKNVGKKIKELRLAREWTLADLAKRSQVTISTLSRIESGKMTGTLESHTQIAQALGVRLAELYAAADPLETAAEHRKAGGVSGKILEKGGGRFDLLTQGPLKKMFPALLTLKAGKSTAKEKTPVGVDKFLYVIKGRLEVEAGQSKFDLTAGDSLYFQASLPHTLKNASPQDAAALVVTSPPAI